MKKFYFTSAVVLAMTFALNAQDKKENDFDKKYRFGLRGAIQPCWYTSNQNNNKPYGANFGTGFGLNVERHFSKIVALNFGIGADFEGGKNTFRQDSVYRVVYWMNNAGQLVKPEDGKPLSDLNNPSNTQYILEERKIKTTHITLPVALKLSTNEYSGFKYFGMFGGEIGIRVKSVATDKYINSYKYNSSGVALKNDGEGASSQANINLSKDCSLIPIRVGFNAGIGTEYRLGGSTSVFMSINYFRSFTSLLRSESDYLVHNIDASDLNAIKYDRVKQNMIQNALRINFGILF